MSNSPAAGSIGGRVPATSAGTGVPGSETPPEKPAPAKTGRGITIGYRPAAVVGPGVEMKAAGEVVAEWEISEQTCERFWSTVLSGIEQVLDFVCEVFLEIPKVPADVWQLDDGQKYVIRTTFRGVTTNILQKVFRAKTPEDADRIVAGLGGVVGFGLMGLKVVWHFIKELPKSPKLAKLKERVAKARAEREKRELEQRRARGENVPAAEAPPALAAAAGGG